MVPSICCYRCHFMYFFCHTKEPRKWDITYNIITRVILLCCLDRSNFDEL